jgi:hypothetical protein
MPLYITTCYKVYYKDEVCETGEVKFKVHFSLQRRVIAVGAKFVNENLMVRDNSVKF